MLLLLRRFLSQCLLPRRLLPWFFLPRLLLPTTDMARPSTYGYPGKTRRPSTYGRLATACWFSTYCH